MVSAVNPGVLCMSVSTRMDSRVDGLESTLSSIQHQLLDHGALLKDHSLELRSVKEILDRLVTTQGRVADDLASLRDGSSTILASIRRLHGEGSATIRGGVLRVAAGTGVSTGSSFTLGGLNRQFMSARIPTIGRVRLSGTLGYIVYHRLSNWRQLFFAWIGQL